MSGWCFGDDALCVRAARAWSVETLSHHTGKKPSDIRKRYPKAGRRRNIGRHLRNEIAALLPGRTIIEVATALDLSPEEVIAEAERHNLLTDYNTDELHTQPRHNHPLTDSEVAAVKRMRGNRTLDEIASVLGRTSPGVQRILYQYAEGDAQVTERDTEKDKANLTARPWSEAELAQLMCGADAHQLAETLGRSYEAVRAKMRQVRRRQEAGK